MLYAWKEQADKLSSEEISKDKYDEWRYHYPEFDTTQIWAKVPSQALSDALVYCSKTSSNQINKDDKKPLAMSFYRKRSIITHQGQKKKHLGQEVQKIR